MCEDVDNRKILCDIAHCAFSVVNDLLFRDQFLARNLRTKGTRSHQIIGKECITDLIATELISKFPQHIELTLFTHPEEAKNGADWYWRFERGSHAIHARVQTKRVQRTDFRQSDDLGHIHINFNQLETLLQVTNNDSQKIFGLEAWYAIYARINADPKCGYSNLNDCDDHHHTGNCKNNPPSLWISKAQDLKSLGIGNLRIIDIISHLIRLDCILPCIGEQRIKDQSNVLEPTNDRSDLPGPNQKGFELKPISQSYDECVDIIQNDPQMCPLFRGALRIYI